MALIRPTAGTMSGKIGNQVFQKNGRVRSFFMPGNPNTAQQQAARSAIAVAALGYAALTEPDADAWTAWGIANPRTNRVGNSYAMTGKQAYIALNAPRIKAGLAALPSAPALGQLNTPVEFAVGQTVTGTITATESTLELTMTGSDFTVGAARKLAVYISPPRSASSRRFAASKLVLAGTVEGNATPVASASINLPDGFAAAGDVYDVLLRYFTVADFGTTEASLTVQAQ